jgi:hypothetical protein
VYFAVRLIYLYSAAVILITFFASLDTRDRIVFFSQMPVSSASVSRVLADEARRRSHNGNTTSMGGNACLEAEG